MLRLRVLGSLGAEISGSPINLGTPRQRAVLAMLIAARGRMVPVDRLTEQLWRGEPPPKAAVSLQTYVSNLRRLLEPDRPPRTPAAVLVSAPPGYALLLPEDAVDAWRFESAVSRSRSAPDEEARSLLLEALRWWRGPAFAENADEEWAGAEVVRLTELHAEARELLVATDLRTGRAAAAVPAAEVLVRESPLREEGWRLLALAQWACGRQADALGSLRRAAAVLRDELGCDPGPALADLEQSLLAQQLEVLHAAAPRPRPRPVPRPTDPSWTRAEVFVGRAEEQHALEAAARAARHGGGAILVTGEAGAGKSALLDRLRERLRAEGWTVLLGRCPEFEGAPPAWAWVEALGALAAECPPQRPEELAPLLRDPEDAPAVAREDVAAARFRMHRAFTGWLRAAASGAPLAVVLDDLHRADGETLALLEAARIDGAPVLVIAAYRPTEAGEHLVKTLAALALRSPHRTVLGGLRREDVAALVAAVCGTGVDEGTLDALVERTGGNPFYVRESARLLAGEGALVAISEVPQGVRDVLRRRLGRLPADARSILQLAAVVGRETEVGVLLDAADADEDEVLDALDAAISADLLTEPAPGRVRFGHALVRDTVYTDLVGVRRARLHARVAQTLRRSRPDDLTALAHHFARSGSTAHAPLTIDYSLRAADLAERRYAHDTAVELIEQAIEACESATGDPHEQPDELVGLLVRLLGAQVRAGSTEAAGRTRQRAVALAEQAGREDLVAATYAAWTEPSPWQSRLDGYYDRTSVARMERLITGADLDGPTLARLLQVLVHDVAAEDPARAHDAARQQLQLARAAGEPRLLAAALMTSTKLLPHEHQADVRAPLTAELRELARSRDLPAYRWVCEHNEAMSAGSRNDPAELRRRTDEGLVLARRYRMLWAQAINSATTAMLACVTGRFEEAEALYTQAGDLQERAGALHAAGMRTLGLITIRLAQGRLREIEPVVRRVHETAGDLAGCVLALALAQQGRLDEARAVGRSSEPMADHLYGIELDHRAQLALLLADRAAAPDLIRRLLPIREQLAGAAGAAYAGRPLAHALADLYRLVGDGQAAAENYALAERTALTWGSSHLAAAARAAAAATAAPLGRVRVS